MENNRADTRLYLSNINGAEYTLCHLLRCSAFTANEDLKQTCFSEAARLKPGIIKTREDWDRICKAIRKSETTLNRE